VWHSQPTTLFLTMSGPSPIVKTRLKGPLHARFLAEQEARGLSESELLRLALQNLFDSADQTLTYPDQAAERPERVVAASPEDVIPERKTVWMPAFLMKAASARATGKGMSFSRWISALVQSNLMRHPVLTETELLVLEASARELAAIGRNINQLARALDEAYFHNERIRLDKLSELSGKITQTRKAMGALVRASRNSWRTDGCR
jgi:hypothetical protein